MVNNITRLIKGTGVGIIIAGLFAGIIVAYNNEIFMAIIITFISFVSWLLFTGFAEIIDLLRALVRNSVNKSLENIDEESNEMVEEKSV